MQSLALLPLLACGCVGLMGKSPGPNEPPPPPGPPCQIIAFWESQVRLAPDPYHGGANNAGLAGWVFLFGADDDGRPITGDGIMVIDLYDLTNGPPVRIEEWRFDKDSLKKLMRKDPQMGGWGYRMFLPWGTYKPTICKVQLRVGYQTPLASTPLFAPETPTSLIHPDPSAMAMTPTPGMMNGLPPAPAPLPAPTPAPANPMLPPPTPVPTPSANPHLPPPTPTSVGPAPQKPGTTAAMADLMRTMPPPAVATPPAPTSPPPPVSLAPAAPPSQNGSASSPPMTPAMSAIMNDFVRAMAEKNAATANAAPSPAPAASRTEGFSPAGQ
jgi:hypothetical protein